jgi:hypothetical protein
MLYETVYDFARDEYWASFCLKITIVLVIGVPLFLRFLGPDVGAGPDSLSFIVPFTLIVLFGGIVVTVETHNRFHRLLSQNAGTIEGQISSLGHYGNRKSTSFRFCLPGGCFYGSDAQNILAHNSSAQNGDYAQVRYTHTAPSWLPPFRPGLKIISIGLAKSERVSSSVQPAD